MHVLTKIFIVLVSLLACLLVPLVVTYAHNENSYASRFDAAESNALALKSNFDAAKSGFELTETKLNKDIDDLNDQLSAMRQRADAAEADLRQAESARVQAESMNTEIAAQLATLASAVETGQILRVTLIDELQQIRGDMLTSEDQMVTMEDALNDAEAKLEVSELARRAIEEELQEMRDEHAAALSELGTYIATYPEINSGDRAGATGRIIPDIDMKTKVTKVVRRQNETIAEIEAGSRDGVRVGWTVMISGPGGFKANLKITNVDINRSTGVVELENAATRGRVQQGDDVYISSSR